MRSVMAKCLKSISLKIILAYVVGVAFSIALILAVINIALLSKRTFFVESDVADYTQLLSEGLIFNDDGVPIAMSDHEDHRPWLFDSLKHEVGYRVLDFDGRVVLSSATPSFAWPNDPQTRLNLKNFEFKQDDVIMNGATKIIEYKGQKWIIQSAISQRFMIFSYEIFALRSMRIGGSTFALVLLVVFAISAKMALHYTLRPLKEVSESAASISTRSLNARLGKECVPTEIEPLVDSFNQVLERLEHGYRLQQEFLATAAHELKTPLALIKAQLELMQKTEETTWLVHDVDYMSRQVQQLLLLAETSEVQNYVFKTIEIADVLNQVVAYLARAAESANVKIVMVHQQLGLTIFADQGAIFTLFKNLLENAIQHAPQCSDVELTISADAISVRDWGGGIETSQLAHIFTRFWRGKHRQDIGAGLGLTICQEIVVAHGWQLTAHNKEPGLEFIVKFNS